MGEHSKIMLELLNVLPCDFFLLKLLLFGLALTSAIAVSRTGELFFPKNGWLAGLFLFLSPVMIGEFAKFENDQFAFPLLFVGFYFFSKGLLLWKQDKWDSFTNQVFGFLFVAIAGIVFWEGAVFFLFGLALSSVFFVVPIVLPLLFVQYFWMTGFKGSQLVWENVQGIGLGYLFLLLFGLLGLPLQLIAPTVFFLILTWFNTKFTVLALPFLAIGMVGVYENWTNSKTILKEIAPSIPRIAIWLLIIFSFTHLLFQPPHEPHFQAIQYALEQTDNKLIQNDWEMGWWVYFNKGKTENIAFVGYQWVEPDKILVTDNNIEIDCPLLKDFNGVRVYDCLQ